MASVNKYRVFMPDHQDPVYRSLWGQVIGEYLDGALVWRYSHSTQTAVIGKLSANGKTLDPPTGGLPYTLTPPRNGDQWALMPVPPDGLAAMVDTDTLPKYDPKTNKPVLTTTQPPVPDTTPPPIGTTPPAGADGVWTAEKERNMRAWALGVDARASEHDARLTVLEGSAPPPTTPPPIGTTPPPPVPNVAYCHQVTFAVSIPVAPNGGQARLSSGSWYSPGQTNRFGEAVPAGWRFAVTDLLYSDKNRDPGGSSGVSIDGIYTIRNHNPVVQFATPMIIPEGTVIDGTIQNDSASGPTYVIVRVHGWYYMPGHEPACVRGG